MFGTGLNWSHAVRSGIPKLSESQQRQKNFIGFSDTGFIFSTDSIYFSSNENKFCFKYGDGLIMDFNWSSIQRWSTTPIIYPRKPFLIPCAGGGKFHIILFTASISVPYWAVWIWFRNFSLAARDWIEHSGRPWGCSGWLLNSIKCFDRSKKGLTII